MMTPEIKSKLDKAIRQLLNAGWNSYAVRDALCKQASFGKYEGCTPTAILDLANELCTASNKAVNQAYREATLKAQRDALAGFQSWPLK